MDEKTKKQMAKMVDALQHSVVCYPQPSNVEEVFLWLLVEREGN